MKHNGLKAIFLDAADTLFYVTGGVGAMYYKVAQQYSPKGTAEEIGSAFKEVFSNAPPLTFPGLSDHERKEREKRYWYDLVIDVFTRTGMFDNFDEYFDELFETFRTKAWQIFHETVPLLQELKNRGLLVIVVSNFDTRIYDVINQLGITHYFDSVITSSESGFAKPDAGIFNIALQKHGLKSYECLHVGDSYRLDYLGAASAGIEAVLLDRKGTHSNEDKVKTIKNLTELIGYIERFGS